MGRLLFAGAAVLSLLACGTTSPLVADGGGGGGGGDGDDAGLDAGVDAGVPDAGPTSCAVRPTCLDTDPNPGVAGSFRSTASSLLALSTPRHRGRDLFVREGQPVFALARFAYGLTDTPLKDEDVEVFLLESCAATSSWRSLGTFRTTEGGGPTVLGVEDNGGRLFVDLSTVNVTLPVGRHRLRYVVRGDLSTADQFIEVLGAGGAGLVVTDIDGTLTTSEYASWTDYIGGPPPDAHPAAAPRSPRSPSAATSSST
ncbi:MAG: hypothetical protein ACOZQL_30590 [Myxococcota bacterium]